MFLSGDRLVSSVSAGLGSQAALRTALVPAPEFVSLTTTRTMTATTTASAPTIRTATTCTTATPSTTGTTPTGGTRSAQRGTGEPGHTQQPNTLAPLVALLRAESAQLKAAEAQLRAAQSKAPQIGATPTPHVTGGSNGSATPVLATSSTRPVVTVELDPSKQSEAKVGEHVTVGLPNGRTVSGRISAVSSIAQSPGGTSGNGGGGGTNTNGSGSTTNVPVTITLRGHASGKGLDQASVSVKFAAARARNVLSVPVTALLATQGGRYALQEAHRRTG